MAGQWVSAVLDMTHTLVYSTQPLQAIFRSTEKRALKVLFRIYRRSQRKDSGYLDNKQKTRSLIMVFQIRNALNLITEVNNTNEEFTTNDYDQLLKPYKRLEASKRTSFKCCCH